MTDLWSTTLSIRVDRNTAEEIAPIIAFEHLKHGEFLRSTVREKVKAYQRNSAYQSWKKSHWNPRTKTKEGLVE